MKTVETEIWVPHPEKEYHVVYKGQRKAKEVFEEIRDALAADGLLQMDEFFDYFSMSFRMEEQGMEFPKMDDLCCYAEWGSNEGIYLNVDILHDNKTQNRRERISFICAKTLEETETAFNRMQYIAGYIYRLFMGDRSVHARYAVVNTGESEKNHIILKERVEKEFNDLLTKKLYHNEAKVHLYADEIALKAMILKVLSKCRFSKDKLEELLTMDNILESIVPLCQQVLEPSCYEIEDVLMSLASFQSRQQQKFTQAAEKQGK